MTRPPDRRLTYLADYDRQISRLTFALRDLALEEAPAAIESVVKGYAVAIGFPLAGKPLKDGDHTTFSDRVALFSDASRAEDHGISPGRGNRLAKK